MFLIKSFYTGDFWDQIMNLPAGEYKIENGRVVSK